MHVFSKGKIPSFSKVGIIGTIFLTNHLTSKAQFVIIETEKGHETTIIETKCDFIYYILEGQGYFLIEDKKESCNKDDIVVIPAGKKFTYKGKLKMLLTITPMFYIEQEITLDN